MVEITDDLGKPVEGHGDLPAAGSRRGRGLFERIEDRSRRKPREWASASLGDAMESHARAVRDAHYGSQGRRSCGDHIAAERLAEAGETSPPKAVSSGHFGHKWLWVALGVGAAAGAGVAVRGMARSPTPAVVNTTRIGTPTISIGPPQ